jgi:REP element-mobilizing transposase RayT
MPDPRGYFLTWTCYGTWLHGDVRGSVDEDHNQFDTASAAPNAARAFHHKARLKDAPTTLDSERRRVVEQTIRDHCEVRRWTMWALSVRTNHVHVIVGAGGVPPGKVMGQLKSWSTRRLREFNLVGEEDRVWTNGGSTRFLWDDDSVARATRYVVAGQGGDLS